MTAYHLAVDIGASSGRHMIGWMEDGKIRFIGNRPYYEFARGTVNERQAESAAGPDGRK